MYDQVLTDPEHHDKAKAFHLLARIVIARQDDQQALLYLRKAFQIWKVTLVAQHPDLILCMKDIVRLYWRKIRRSITKQVPGTLTCHQQQ